MNLEKFRREEIRWRILRIADAGRPIGVTETQTYRVLHDCGFVLGPAELRREVEYLKTKDLIEFALKKDGTWWLKLTAVGIDFVEYATPDLLGIDRPPISE